MTCHFSFPLKNKKSVPQARMKCRGTVLSPFSGKISIKTRPYFCRIPCNPSGNLLYYPQGAGHPVV